MKHSIVLYILSLILPVAFSSCEETTRTALPDDTLMERLLREKPDSLAMLLEDQIDPSELPDDAKADYAYWLARIHDRQGRSLINDSLIHFAAGYYKQTDSPRLIEALTLAARQSNWSMNKSQEHARLLKEAIQAADARQDTILIKELGNQLIFLYTENDTKELKHVISYLKKYAPQPVDIRTNYLLTFPYGMINQWDSARYYAGLAFEQAYAQKDPLLYGTTLAYVHALNATGQSKKALEVLRRADKVKRRQGQSFTSLYINTWMGLRQLDSARVYMDSYRALIDVNRYILPEETNHLEQDLILQSMILEVLQGKPVTGLPKLNLLSDMTRQRSRVLLQIDRERQYVESKLVAKNFMLEIERGKLRQQILWAVVIALFVIASLVIVYQRKLLKKERSIQKTKEELRLYGLQLSDNQSLINKNEELINTLSAQVNESGEVKQQIELLNKENSGLEHKNAQMREREQFLTTQLIAHTEVLNKLNKKPRYIEITQWPQIVHAVNQLFDGFSYRLAIDFPTLTEEDIQYCCLLKLHLSTSVIATLTAISPSSVTKRKQRIKEKMSQQRPGEIQKDQPIETYLWNY